MCLSSAYWSTDLETPILKEIAYIQLDKNKIILHPLMADQKVIKGIIRHIDFMNARIILDKEDDILFTSK